MSTLATCLWFDSQAEEASRFYVDTFTRLGRPASIRETSRHTEGGARPAGSALVVGFTLDGQSFMVLNGGPHFTFSPAISLAVTCRDQAEVDAFWDALCEGGGSPGRCGWLTDRFGLSWQVVPSVLPELMRGDPDRAARVMRALMGMSKLEIAALERA